MPETERTEIVIDANVIVAFWNPRDVHHERAAKLLSSLASSDVRLVLIDFVVEESLSVLCRHAQQKAWARPMVAAAIVAVRSWLARDIVFTTADKLASSFGEVLDIVQTSNGSLNVDDAKLVYLQRQGIIDTVPSFDARLAAVPDFRCMTEPAA